MNNEDEIWRNQLLDGLENGYLSRSFREYLDEFLNWFASIEKTSKKGFSKKIIQHVGDLESTKGIVFDLIRTYLFEDLNQNSMLFYGTRGKGEKVIKKRYFRLMQTFHPDRGFTSDEILNNCAEIINRVYQDVLQQEGSSDYKVKTENITMSKKSKPTKNNKKTSKKPSALNKAATKTVNDIGQKLRDSKLTSNQLRNRIIVCMLFGATLLTIYLYQMRHHQDAIISEEQHILAQLGVSEHDEVNTVKPSSFSQEKITETTKEPNATLVSEKVSEKHAIEIDNDIVVINDEEKVSNISNQSIAEIPFAQEVEERQQTVTLEENKNSQFDAKVKLPETQATILVKSEVINPKVIVNSGNEIEITKTIETKQQVGLPEVERTIVRKEDIKQKTNTQTKQEQIVRAEIKQDNEVVKTQKQQIAKIVEEAAKEKLNRFGPVKKGQTLFYVAKQLRADIAVTENQMVWALFRSNPHAFSGDSVTTLRVGSMLLLPDAEVIIRVTDQEASEKLGLNIKLTPQIAQKEIEQKEEKKPEQKIEKTIESKPIVIVQKLDEKPVHQLGQVEKEIAAVKLNRKAVNEFISQFSTDYNNGSLNEFVRHYTAYASENNVKGRTKITEMYKHFFSTTRLRNMRVEIDKLKQEDDLTALLDGTILLDIILDRGVNEKMKLNFEMVLIKGEGGYKLVNYAWKRIR